MKGMKGMKIFRIPGQRQGKTIARILEAMLFGSGSESG